MPAPVAFYNLAGHALEPALAALLEAALAAGERAVVLVGNAERLNALNAGLWTYHPASFLPHGSAADGRPEQQPIWLTTADENPNGAALLVLVEGADSAALEAFARCIYLFDRTDPPARDIARDRYRRYREAGHALTYRVLTAQGWKEEG